MPIDTLLRAVDWFVPEELRANTAMFWRARIFAISHLLGPCLGVVIFIYLFLAEPNPGLPFFTLCVCSAAFWALPFAMKLTKRLTGVALFSICDLTFVSVFGSFFYGGVSSPFLPWFLTALLLGFFYLGDKPFLVLSIFALHMLGFCIAYLAYGAFPEIVPLESLSRVGVISVCAATLYTSMMALYYANVIMAQSELRQEIQRHLVTADKMLRAKEQADRANEAKGVFLAKMSHQLRTPLNAVIGYSEILLEDAEQTGHDAKIADLKTINSAGRHLLSLVADVLDMPSIDSGHVEVQTQRFDVRRFLDDVVATCRSLVTANGNKFVIDVVGDLGEIYSDETRLRQILINLLSNAGKFTQDGTVTLRATRDGDHRGEAIILAVEDTGIGIARDCAARLFTEYSQGDVATASVYGGTGLGLALSRKLCYLLKGDIGVESELGRGSTFTVRIPVGPEPAAVAA